MTSPQRPYEILIAEDNSSDMLLVHNALDHQGICCNLHTASDGAAAIALIEHYDHEPHPVDLMIIDLHLPVYDGPAILKHLRCTTHLRTTQVIVLSGLSVERIRAQTIKYGLVHPFTKPADLTDFMKLGPLAYCILTSEMPTGAESQRSSSKETRPDASNENK